MQSVNTYELVIDESDGKLSVVNLLFPMNGARAELVPPVIDVNAGNDMDESLKQFQNAPLKHALAVIRSSTGNCTDVR